MDKISVSNSTLPVAVIPNNCTLICKVYVANGSISSCGDDITRPCTQYVSINNTLSPGAVTVSFVPSVCFQIFNVNGTCSLESIDNFVYLPSPVKSGDTSLAFSKYMLLVTLFILAINLAATPF
ncbi:hypothetical protein BB559_000010 [Furculomyces boomerangus]|uniref:Uncharacterized protein n=2 Tax=Harpellales TaxID=61421 RepID=A0A2T9Z6K3_9FUNG|nr:hypothetical protein BB559_000010 [Furculomyces boomerangus]PVZ99370.1 hypothetical protein BB558_004605 [Smittium angustum]